MGLAISQMVDLHEGQLVESIQELMSRPERSEEEIRRLLIPLLAKILAQPLSAASLRKALRAQMSVEMMLPVLEVLNGWVKWWVGVGIGQIRAEGGDDEDGKKTDGEDKENRSQTKAVGDEETTSRRKAEKMDGVSVPALDHVR